MSEIGSGHQEKTRLKIPNRIVFDWRLRRVLKENLSQIPPPFPENPTAADIARYGRADWKDMEANCQRRTGKSFGDYLYALARHLATPPEEGEERIIRVLDSWKIINGRHTALALRILGPDLVEKSAINNWVKVDTIRDPH